MYMAHINDVMGQDNMYPVSFLKKHTDGSYYWPDKEYICDVDDTDVLKMSIPSEDILPVKAAIVRVKLSFDSHLHKETFAELMNDLLQTCYKE